MNRITLNDTLPILRDGDDFLILTHKRPDGDTLGSAGALCSALLRLGKRACLFPNNGITDKYAPMVSRFIADGDVDTSIVVSVDVASENLFPSGWQGKVDLAIDHHPSNSGFAVATLLWDDRASCGEIVLELIKSLCGELTGEEANLLYTAVSTDCGCFQYSNTTADTFRSAAQLLEAGADTQRLNKLLFRSLSPARLKLEGMIYSSLRSYHDNRVNFALVTQDMIQRSGATDNDMDDIASLAGRVQGSLVSVTIKERIDGGSKISLRSTDALDASALCAVFGGGGHKRAAGCEMDCPPEEAAQKLLSQIERAIKW